MRRTFTNEDEINTHIEMTFKYTKNAEGLFVCQHCPFTSGPQSTMHYHMKSKHNGDLKHVCKFCNNKFVQKCLLDLHIQSQHKDELDKRSKQFQCPFEGCQVHDLRKGNIVSHFCRVHMKDLIDKAFIGADSKKSTCISCSNCKKEFASKPSFNYHVASCIKPSTCHPAFDPFHKLNNLEAVSV